VSQVNVNAPPPGERPIETVDSSDRTAAAGINLITVLIVLAVLAVIAWYLFTGPLRSFGGGGTTNVNVNTPSQPAPTVNVNVPNPGSNNSAPSGNPGNTGTRP
jgi:hypothetical protein